MARRHESALAELRQSCERLRLVQADLEVSNASEHARLSREAEQVVARISADGRVLDHVRELIRFFKQA